MTFELLLAALAAEAGFPERTPTMIEACITTAVASKNMSKTSDSYKYICGDDVAQELWSFLENAKV
jgi:hypothetical protein